MFLKIQLYIIINRSGQWSVQVKSPGHNGDGLRTVVVDLHTEQTGARDSGLPTPPSLGEDVSAAEGS